MAINNEVSYEINKETNSRFHSRRVEAADYEPDVLFRTTPRIEVSTDILNDINRVKHLRYVKGRYGRLLLSESKLTYTAWNDTEVVYNYNKKIIMWPASYQYPYLSHTCKVFMVTLLYRDKEIEQAEKLATELGVSLHEVLG